MYGQVHSCKCNFNQLDDDISDKADQGSTLQVQGLSRRLYCIWLIGHCYTMFAGMEMRLTDF